jgi:hypothetical protein
MEGIMMASARPGVEAWATPVLGLVGKIKGQALVDSHLCEVSWLDGQAEDLGEKLGRRCLVFGWHDGVV